MPFQSDEAQSSQPRVVIMFQEPFLENHLNLETCTNFIEADTNAATQVATPQLSICATFPLAHVHITPLIQFPINLVTPVIRIL